MIKNKLLVLFTILSALALVACGSSSSSGGGGGGGGLGTGTFTKTDVLDGAPTGNSGIFGTNAFRHYQNLYRAQELTGSGNINTVRLRYDGAQVSATTCPNTTIKLGQTSVANLGTDMTANVQQGKGTLVTVLNDATVTIPAGADGDYFDIPLSTSFYYNGVDNLVLDMTRSTACSQTVSVVATPATVTYTAYAYSTNAGTPDTATTTNTIRFDAQYVFAGGDNKVDLIASPNGNTAPLTANSAIQKIQMLYNASSIDGNGPITGIGLQIGSLTSANTYTYTMKLGHTSRTDLVATYADNINVGSPVTVANSTTFTVPAGVPVGDFIWLPIPDSIFTYNSTDNLVIELTVEAGSGTTTLATHPTTNINRIYGNPANADAATLNSYTHQIALRFNGGTIDNITGQSHHDNIFFDATNSGKSQFLYNASELGTSGKITGVACRLYQPNPTITDYTNTEVVLAHRTASVLSSTFADNIAGGVTTYSGTYSMVAGLLQGDWIEIPFSTPFVYNGTDNLVIQIAADASAGHSCYLQSNATLYADRRLSSADRLAVGSTPSNFLLNSRFMISK